MSHGFWWHVFHDPMIENPWSFLVLMAIVGGSACLWWAVVARKQ